MGPPENLTPHPEKQEARGARPEPGGVCSRDASGASTPNTRGSAIAAMRAGRRRGCGRSGRPGRLTARRRRASGRGTGKAVDTGSASKSENHLRKRPFRRPRGSSLEIFFDDCCDRPGCYECFLRSRRSPLQRFCSHACRRAVERVWERERRWRRKHARHRHFPGRRPRARQP
jgi:hypothetical protein